MSVELFCPDPGFSWDRQRGAWSACIRCGRLPWDHEQASPIEDLRQTMRALHEAGAHGSVDWSTLAPVMLNPAELVARDDG